MITTIKIKKNNLIKNNIIINSNKQKYANFIKRVIANMAKNANLFIKNTQFASLLKQVNVNMVINVKW